jgi:lipopolysaccharide export system permease protein
VTLTYGRMSSDNEVMAMRASGIHMICVMLPGLLLGLLLSGGLYMVNDHLLPYCRRAEYKVHRAEAANMLPEIFRSRRSFDFREFQLSWDDFKGETFYGLKVTQRNPEGVITMDCTAETATYHLLQAVDSETGKHSYQLQLRGENVTGMNYPDVRFAVKEKEQTIPLKDIEPRDPGPKASSIGELFAYLRRLKEETPKKNEDLANELKKLTSETETKTRRLKAQLAGGDTDEATAHRLRLQIQKMAKDLDTQKKKVERLTRVNNQHMRNEISDVRIKIHERLSLAASGLALVILGIPLGILSGGGHMLKAFVLACVPVLVFYYPLFILGHNLAETRVLGEVTALWGPTILLIGIGGGLMGYLFRR